VRVTDAMSATATRSYDLTVVGALEITTAALPDARTGEPYDTSLAVDGGTGPFAWSVSAGTLPTGLALSAGGVTLAVLLALVLGGVQSVIRATVAEAAPEGRAGVTFGLLQVGSKLSGALAGLAFGGLYLATDLPRAGLAALLVQILAGWWALRSGVQRR